ncbi:MAG: nuclease-related domain-containing protein [Rhodospirillales bacterium]|nr:nuclease-related domain-containing protein [Rhodospirillales bacterium]
MIVKPYENGPVSRDARAKAGVEAERQMAHYLHRRFKDAPDVFVLHGLRIEDGAQPEQDGSSGVCQVDHLILHRWGMFIVETKSVTEEVRVRPDGSGGDEWTRVYRGREQGMRSPIRQAKMQSELLRSFLQRHREELVGRHAFGLRNIARIGNGTDQRGFRHAPMQLVIAISDKGRIQRHDGWREPRQPFRAFVTKADLVPDKIGDELERHRRGARVLDIRQTSEYGLWYMELPEVRTVADFLAERHTLPQGAPVAASKPLGSRRRKDRSGVDATGAASEAEAACKECGATDLTARWGRYGYHWSCNACGANTKIPVACSKCGGPEYFRDCKVCGATETVWLEA